jgi:hypothetical protein
MPIRLNPDLLPDLLTAIQNSQQDINTATQQLSSGRSVNQLSDNPAAVATLVGNHNQAAQDDQFLQNTGTLQTRLQVSDSALSNVVAVLTRAVSIGTEGANGTLSAADRQAVAGEVQGLSSQLLSLANTTYQGTYLFSGYCGYHPAVYPQQRHERRHLQWQRQYDFRPDFQWELHQQQRARQPVIHQRCGKRFRRATKSVCLVDIRLQYRPSCRPGE